MKNIKNIFFSIASIITLLATQPTMAMSMANFELYNKSNKAIRVNLDGEESTVSSMRTVSATYPNKQKNISLTIYPDVSSNKNVKKFTINTQAETIFVSWNPVKAPFLYPQTGPLLGLLGVTKSGWALNPQKNVKQSEIRPMR